MSETESSFDGSLNESYESEAPDPALMFAPSPASTQDFSLGATLPIHRRDEAVKIMYSQSYENHTDEHSYGLDESGGSDDRSTSNILDNLGAVDSIPNCNKVSSILSGMGFPSVQIVSSDIDPSTSSIPTIVIDSWAESVLSALAELQDRVQTQRNTITSVGSNTARTEANQASLQKQMHDLQEKLRANEQRERAALLKIKMLEEGSERRDKSSGADVKEMQKQLRNMDSQRQELERRNRAKDVEIERLKQKLAQLAEKERETNQRNRHILTQIKSGDVTFMGDKAMLASPPPSPEADKSNLSARRTPVAARSGAGAGAGNTSFHSVGSKGTRTSAGTGVHSPSGGANFVNATTVVSLAAVVDALEQQRKELFARNKELELQVRDSLQALRRAENTVQQLQQQEQQQQGNTRDGYEHQSGAAWGEDRRDDRRNRSPVRGGNADSSAGRAAVQGPSSAVAQQMLQRIQHQEGQIEALQRQQELSQAVVAERDETIATLRQRNQDLHSEIDNLRSLLDARPTMRQWTEAQREREQLEEKLHDLILLRGEAAEIAMWRKHLSTAERIKVDKRNHELGLWLLDSLPKATMKEVLQTVCRELDISEISEIQPCLVKLKAVVKSVPRMERFISQVCGFVFQRHPSLGNIDGMPSTGGGSSIPAPGPDGQPAFTMDHMLPILRRWWYAAQRCVELDAFHSRVLLELYRRQELLAYKAELATSALASQRPTSATHVRDNTSLEALKVSWEAEGKHAWALREPERIFEMVRDLVDFQVEVMHHDQSLIYAEDYIRDRPEILVNRIVGHLQYLFEIKSLDGVLPRMNQIYLFVEEMRNFLTAARASVQIRPGFANGPQVTNSMLLAEVHRRLALFASQQTGTALR